MNWQSTLAALGGLTVLLAGSGVLAKSVIERLLDRKLKEMEDRNRILLAETVRRQATVFDQQFEALKQVLSAANRLRNRAREMKGCEDSERHLKIARVASAAAVLEEMLIDYRAIIPEEIFRIAHRIKGGARMAGGRDEERELTDLFARM